MNIKEEDKLSLRNIVIRYSEIHRQINSLEKEMLELVDKKNIVIGELKSLRETEISLINKIEEETGVKLDQSTLTEIIQS